MGFDGQKLMLHPVEVAQWLETGQTRGPLYTEFELTSVCNHHCTFCGVDHLVNQSHVFIDTALALRAVDEIADSGNKSIMFAGHGESLLHPDAADIIVHASSRMSTSVTTNGSRVDAKRVHLIDGLEWIRFSVNGFGDEYRAVHATSAGMFEQVMGNIAGAVARKREKKLGVTIGTQIVLLPENAAGAVPLAKRLRDIGVDYFSVKPYSQHPASINRRDIDYAELVSVGEACKALATPEFAVSFRTGSIDALGKTKSYSQCYGTHFLNFVSADGKVWECNVHAGDERFLFGDLNESSFGALWSGEQRASVVRFIDEELDLTECRDVCRLEACNRYLFRLKHPRAHDNFI